MLTYVWLKIKFYFESDNEEYLSNRMNIIIKKIDNNKEKNRRITDSKYATPHHYEQLELTQLDLRRQLRLLHKDLDDTNEKLIATKKNIRVLSGYLKSRDERYTISDIKMDLSAI